MKDYDVHAIILALAAIMMGGGFGLTITKLRTSPRWRVRLVGPLLVATSFCIVAPYVAGAIRVANVVELLAYLLGFVLFAILASAIGLLAYALTCYDPDKAAFEQFAKKEEETHKPKDTKKPPFRHLRDHSETGILRRLPPGL